MTDLDTLIDRVRELDKAATNGPWVRGHNPEHREPLDYIAEAYSYGTSGRVHLTCVPFCDRPIDDEALFTAITGNGPTSEQNAALIAFYRTAAPELADECERLRDELAVWRDGVGRRWSINEALRVDNGVLTAERDTAAAECERLRERVGVLEGLLTRVVKYATEDRAVTPVVCGVGRLGRVVSEARAALEGKP